jgi:hypothetical protein
MSGSTALFAASLWGPSTKTSSRYRSGAGLAVPFDCRSPVAARQTAFAIHRGTPALKTSNFAVIAATSALRATPGSLRTINFRRTRWAVAWLAIWTAKRPSRRAVCALEHRSPHQTEQVVELLPRKSAPAGSLLEVEAPPKLLFPATIRRRGEACDNAGTLHTFSGVVTAGAYTC